MEKDFKKETQKQEKQSFSLSRRHFLMTGLGSCLGFGFLSKAGAEIILPQKRGQDFEEIQEAGNVFEPNLWCRIDEEGFVYIHLVKAELGQHIGSAIARLIAEEMEADWNKIRLVYLDTETRFKGYYCTKDAHSVWESWDIYRQAGAAVKYMMRERAAAIFSTIPEKCLVENGNVSYEGQNLSFGDIVKHGHITRQISPEEMANLPLKDPTAYRFIGMKLQALDIEAKITGRAPYSIDAHFDDMLYARPCLPPTRYGAKVVSVDDTEAREIDGYEGYFILEDPSETIIGWVVVLAHNWFAAVKAADILRIRWTDPVETAVEEKDLQEHAEELLKDSKIGSDIYHDKDVEMLLKTGDNFLDQTYYCDPVAHFALEPLNVLIRKIGDVWEIHSGNHWQSLALGKLAKLLGVSEDKIIMKNYFVGGSFGRKLSSDYLIPAALTSQLLGGRAVKLLFTRSDDMIFDTLRSPSLQRIQASFNGDDKSINAMRYDVVAGWPTLAEAPSYLRKGVKGEYDPASVSGADHWYEVGPFHLRAVCNGLVQRSLRPGWFYGGASGWTLWALESFMDEAADLLHSDPISFRFNLLTGEGRNGGVEPDSVGGARRQAAVLKRLGEVIDWGSINYKLPKDEGIGVACGGGESRDMPTWCALAAHVHVERQKGVVRCKKIWVVIDAGIIIDPDGAEAQIEGAVLWGLSMALFEGAEIKDGLIKARNLNHYTPLRISDVPEIHIEFMENAHKPTGLNGVAVGVVAPAIGNAIFNAVKVRLRKLPMNSEELLKAFDQIQKNKA